MKKDVYRKSALERLATVDQLDKVMKITSPLSWLALLGVTLIIVVTALWSIVGKLPSTVTANGMIVSATTATNTLIANSEGTVVFQVNEGQRINKGDVYARITPNGSYGEPIDCIADQYCWGAKRLVDNGTAVTSGSELLRVRPVPRDNQKHVIVCYVPFSDIGKIDYGMTATITLTSAESSTYGHMEGQVINIDTYATSNKGIEAVVGMDNNMESQFVQNGSVSAVTLEPLVSTDHPGKKNDYWWSNEKGFNLEFNDKMMCTVKITTKTERPITKLFTKLKDIWGGEV